MNLQCLIVSFQLARYSNLLRQRAKRNCLLICFSSYGLDIVRVTYVVAGYIIYLLGY